MEMKETTNNLEPLKRFRFIVKSNEDSFDSFKIAQVALPSYGSKNSVLKLVFNDFLEPQLFSHQKHVVEISLFDSKGLKQKTLDIVVEENPQIYYSELDYRSDEPIQTTVYYQTSFVQVVK